ncbi:hypothetical protein [Sphingomonas immobilis]|uniref:Uncharacterized protein n=1 Tax=Sphingomonas immobilis TaxID=3063997 RepID=A0ABT8ZU21_9SPHN|nr:hypothetical protein [Sphingomonas sp. CA1-15]MDO7841076.1 hypothetical protein [Sphingomonas sp. CA1-15]
MGFIFGIIGGILTLLGGGLIYVGVAELQRAATPLNLIETTASVWIGWNEVYSGIGAMIVAAMFLTAAGVIQAINNLKGAAAINTEV